MEALFYRPKSSDVEIVNSYYPFTPATQWYECIFDFVFFADRNISSIECWHVRIIPWKGKQMFLIIISLDYNCDLAYVVVLQLGTGKNMENVFGTIPDFFGFNLLRADIVMTPECEAWIMGLILGTSFRFPIGIKCIFHLWRILPSR